jgi:hypothetical protein
LPATSGGTNQSSYAVGDLLYASTTTALSKLADVATGNALISGGVGVAPSYGKIGLTTHVSGVLPVANGGTNASAASITAFNNITGYTASGATGTTSTNLVFSTSPSITTPTLVGNVTLSTGNLILGTSGKGVTDSTGVVALNFTSTAATLAAGNLVVSGGAVTAKATTTNGSTYAFQATNNANTDLMSARSDGLITTGTAGNSPYNLTTGSAANMFVDSNGWVFRSTSSAKYKTDIQDATHGLAELIALRPVTYKQKSLGPNGEIDEKVYGGLLAEQVDELGLTEFVQYAQDGTPDALHYGNMVALCVKAIKEQHQIIQTLKSQLDALIAK